MTPTLLSSPASIALSLIFSYIPGISPRYEALTANQSTYLITPKANAKSDKKQPAPQYS